MKTLYAYGCNEEDFGFCEEYEKPEDGFDDAFAELDLIKNVDELFYGKCAKHVPTISASSIIDQLQDEAYSECGDHSQDFLCGLNKEQINDLEESLNAALLNWLCRHNLTPQFYTVVDIKSTGCNEL